MDQLTKLAHYACTGECGGVSLAAKVCESETCSRRGQPLAACNCTDGEHKEIKSDHLEKPAV